MRNPMAALALTMMMVAISFGQGRRAPEVVETIDGDQVYKLLPVGEIPAIDDPEFVSGEEADREMRADEPVIGIVMGDEARAYSLWQLDAHEIVNDVIEGSAIAVTW